MDDTLLLVKPCDIDLIHQNLNSFDSNLRFTVDTFKDTTPHFLDLTFETTSITVHRKATNTGVYINFDSFTPWAFRISWINSLVYRAKRLCCETSLPEEIAYIKKLASWNGFPKWVVKKVIDKVLINVPNENANPLDETDVITIWPRCPYLETKGDHLTRSAIRKIWATIKS